MAGTYKPGDTYNGEFTTRGSSGGANADSLPTASMAHNLVDDGTVTLTVANIDTGRYSVTGTIPSGYAVGDKVSVKIAATVSGISDKVILEQFVLDNRSADVLTSVSGVNAKLPSSVPSLAQIQAGLPTDSSVQADVTASLTAQGYTSARAPKLDNLDAAVSSRSTYAGGAVASVTGAVGSVTAPVTAGTVTDKTGYQLASNGLDIVSTADVTSDTDARSTLPKMLRWLFGRFANSVSQTATQQTVSNDSGTVVSTMTVSDNGTTATKSKSS